MGESHVDDFLVKKMEEMRKKNEEILRRHQEIEEDKMYADQFSNNAKERRKNMDIEKVPRVTTARSPRIKAPASDNQSTNSFKSDGPPPDPNYNFLLDPSRKQSDSSSDDWRNPERNSSNSWGQSRRHHTNYGGSDFRNVKSVMEKQKMSYKKNQAGSSQNAGDLTMQMTGKQRLQHEAWKKEQEKVDQARIERQRNSDGSWRREWDSHKSFESDEESEAQLEYRPKSFQRQRMQGRRADVNSNTGAYLQRSQSHRSDNGDSDDEDHERIPRTGKVFRPSAKSSRFITGGDGGLSITLTNNVKLTDDALDREALKGHITQRKKCEANSPKVKSSLWTFLVSESNPPQVPSHSEVPKPLYPGWQTNEEKGTSKSFVESQCSVQELTTQIASTNLNNQKEHHIELVPIQEEEHVRKENVHVGVKNTPEVTKNSSETLVTAKDLLNDSDIYYSDDNLGEMGHIEVLRSDIHIEEMRQKLEGLDIAEEKNEDDDDEWEDVSEEDGDGNSCS